MIKRADRIHMSIHLAWADRGGPSGWVCRWLQKHGSFVCGNESAVGFWAGVRDRWRTRLRLAPRN